MTRRWTSSEVKEISVALLESSVELVVSIWRVFRSRRTRALVFRTGSSSEEQSRVRWCCRRASCGVEDGNLEPSDDWSIGLHTGVKKRLWSMLLRISLTRITSCIAGVKREGGSESTELFDSLSNLNSFVWDKKKKSLKMVAMERLIWGRCTERVSS